MKTIRWIALPILALAAMTLFFGCSLSSTSIKDRINDFFDSLNGADRSGTYKNLQPGTSAYSLADNGFWHIAFPEGNEPYSYASLDTTNASAVTMTINDTAGFYGAYTFVMVNIGSSSSENWVISDIQTAGGTIFH